MTDRDQSSDPQPRPRRRFLQSAAAAGAVLATGAVAVGPGKMRAAPVAAACNDTVVEALSALLVLEQLAATFYFTGLTARAVVGHPYLAGVSADPNQVASNGNRVNVACLQAALDQERQHATLLTKQGARSSTTQFYFPAGTFTKLGYTTEQDTFLWVLDRLETAMVGAYLAAINRLAVLRQVELTVLVTRMFGPECQHRAIGRVIAGDTPANNMALQVVSFNCAEEVSTTIKPYLTGTGFAHGATKAVALPTAAAMARVIGKNRSS